MADTLRDIANELNPNQGWDLLRYIAPALLSALEANLPLSARPYAAEELAVAADTTGALDFAGEVTEVEATAGGAPGVYTIVTAAPAAGEAQVVYDSAGVPTVNFNVADAVTEARVKANKVPADFLARLAEGAWA